MRIAIVAELANPVATNWTRGLAAAGAQVVVLDQRLAPATPEQLEDWHIPAETAVVTLGDSLSPSARGAVMVALGGPPDVIFAWCGKQVLAGLDAAVQAFPRTPAVLRIETLPNASGRVAEARETLRFNGADRAIDGYAFYSPVMRAMFHQRVPGSRGKPAIDMVEPFPLSAYAGSAAAGEGPRLRRDDARPHIIYTGRSDLLWGRDPRMARDRMGPFLERLVACGVAVAVKPDDGTAASRGLLTYPHFSNSELFSGSFARYIEDFDAHLVAYHESNATVRRRVRTSLSTRFAFALTATTPLAVSARSDFVRPLQAGAPFALEFTSAGDLARQLDDAAHLQRLRQGLGSVHEGFAMERQAPRMLAFLRHVVAQAAGRRP